MTTIATFTTPEDAHLFRAYLGDLGIEALLKDEHFIQLFWYYSNTIGGVRVAVDDSNQDDATAAYQTYMEALRAGPYPVNPVRAWPIVLLLSFYVGIPFMLFGRKPLWGQPETEVDEVVLERENTSVDGGQSAEKRTEM